MFKDKLKDLITLLETWLSDPEDGVQLENWIESAKIMVHSFEFTDMEEDCVHHILDLYIEQFKKKLEGKNTILTTDLPTIEYLDDLIGRKQIEQRTPEWYKQMSEIISASELGNLFAAPRQRAKLVVSKTVPYPQRNQALAVCSDKMSAFDWGIRFEPVVKQIYEYKYGTTIKELGRLHHPTDPRCTASPDGLIYHCPKNERRGRLIEIKCPVTREIDGSVPKDYYAQMQMQLQVTGLKYCDYVEAKFVSPYNQIVHKDGPTLYHGWIALVRYEEMNSNQEFYYIYSPVNATEDWKPIIKENEDIIEMIPWRLVQWSEQLIIRNEEWWTSLKPTIDAFWEDVEKARRGEFNIPESTRPSKKPKIEKCMIQFHKMEENTMELN
jgi:hypothetical protein